MARFCYPSTVSDPLPPAPAERKVLRLIGPYKKLGHYPRLPNHVNALVRGVMQVMADRRINYSRAVAFYATDSGQSVSSIRIIFRAYATPDEVAWVQRRMTDPQRRYAERRTRDRMLYAAASQPSV